MDDVHSRMDTVKKRQLERQNSFLLAFAELGTIRHAVEAAEIVRQSVYDWDRGNVQGFSQRLEQARCDYREKLERLMFERLESGKANPVTEIFALKGAWPEKYGDRVTVQDDTSRDMLSILRARPGSTVVIEGTGRELPAGNATDAKDQD